MKEDVFYKTIGSRLVHFHAMGRCCLKKTIPTSFYYVPSLNVVVVGEHEKEKEWNLLKLKGIPKDAQRISVEKEKLERVKSSYEAFKNANKKESKEIFDYQKKQGELPNSELLRDIYSKFNSDELRSEFQKACEEAFAKPISQ